MNPKPDKMIPALYGGVIMALLSSVPFLSLINCFCCAGLLFGGFIAVFFYKNQFTPDTPPFASADCMAVGALAGVISAVIGTILSMIFMALFGDMMSQFVLSVLRNSNVELPPNLLDQIEQSMGTGMTGFVIVTRLISNIVLHVIFGLLGGLIGYSIFKPKNVPMMPSPPMSPPPQASV